MASTVARPSRWPHLPRRPDASEPPGENYKWVALANTTAAVFMSQLDGSIVLIALPAIFRGIISTRCCPRTSPSCCGC